MPPLFSFVSENLPSFELCLKGAPPGLLWSYLSLRVAGELKRKRGWPTGYTRKVFHVLTFLTAAAVQAIWGLPGVFLFGGVTTLVLAYALWRGDGHTLYEALARERDAPHRTYYIVIPFLTTLLGGLVSNLWFGSNALVGYLVGGLGDATGEPVGTRWGRHPYTLPLPTRVRSTRSVEGSLGVFVTSLAAAALAVAILPGLDFTVRSIVLLPVAAMAAALVEAASPHGWDNLTMQIVPSLLAASFF